MRMVPSIERFIQRELMLGMTTSTFSVMEADTQDEASNVGPPPDYEGAAYSDDDVVEDTIAETSTSPSPMQTSRLRLLRTMPTLSKPDTMKLTPEKSVDRLQCTSSSVLRRGQLAKAVHLGVSGSATCAPPLVSSPARNRSGRTRTTNFWRHLKKNHRPQHDSIALPQDATQNGSEGAGGDIFTRSHAVRTTAILARWLVAASHPFSLVEQPLFRYSASLRQAYQVPCRQTISDKIRQSWETNRQLVRTQLYHDLGEGRRWSATTDMWTSSARGGYMVITMHYIDNYWRLRSVILAFKRVVYPHTGERLGQAFVGAVDNMETGLMSSLWTVTADNPSNNPLMVGEMNEVVASQPHTWPFQPQKIAYVRCLAHVIQLAVKEGIASCQDINHALGGLRELVKKFQDSPKLYEKYQLVCQSLEMTATRFKLDVETRWNSTYDMIDHLLKSRTAIIELIHRVRSGHREFSDLVIDGIQLTSDSWTGAELYRSFLEPFKDATVLLSGSTYPTLSVVPLLYQTLQMHVNKTVQEAELELDLAFREATGAEGCDTPSPPSSTAPLSPALVAQSTEAAPVRQKTRREMAAWRAVLFFKGTQAKLAKYQDLAVSKEALLAAALDPRYKKLATSSTRQLLVDEFNQFYRRRLNNQNPERFDDENRSLLSPPSKIPRLLGLMKESAGVESFRPSRRSIEQEACDWFESEGIKMDASSRDVCDWFRTSAANDYPRISLMARDFMSVPATSVPSEQAFSRAGCIVSERRARLGDEAVQAISELQSFLAFNNSAAVQ